MPACTDCGAELDVDAPFCPECGAAVEGAASGVDGVESDDRGAVDEPDMRDNWWHVIVAFPLVALSMGFGLRGWIISIPAFCFFVLYPVAVWQDAKYVRAAGGSWQPGRKLAAGLAVAFVVSLGLLSFLVSPYYLYRRFTGLD